MAQLVNSHIIDSQPKILRQHLSLCLDFLLREVDDVIAIILTGGYGRGEGTWLKENDAFKPYNDYDFVVVHGKNYRKLGEKLNTEELAASLGIKWVDVDIFSYSKFKKMRPSVKNYDILNGSIVIYGDPDFLKKANKISPSQISSKDLFIFYYTRAYTLLCCLPSGKVLSEINHEEMIFFRNQLAKGFLALQDCELISDYNFYCSSYIERTKYYEEHSDNLEKVKWFNWALKEKLDPSNNYLDLNQCHEAYESLLSYYQIDMNNFLARYFYGINITLKNFQILELSKPVLLAKYILSRCFSSYDYLKKERALNHMQYILINTWPDSQNSKEFELYIPKLESLIHDAGYDIPADLSWYHVQDIIRKAH